MIYYRKDRPGSKTRRTSRRRPAAGYPPASHPLSQFSSFPIVSPSLALVETWPSANLGFWTQDVISSFICQDSVYCSFKECH